MANHYFQFKQFTITQHKAAMKVGTDGVLLGAWANCEHSKRALDIGTGTGLIALMLAQRNTTLKIDAIEIDSDAIEDAHSNFDQSLWKDRIFLHPVSLQVFVQKNSTSYDLIVANPPFFNNSLKPDGTSRSIARHSDTLPSDVLFSAVKKLLKPQGIFCVIIPTDVFQTYQQQAFQNGLYSSKLLWIKTTPNKIPKRILIEFTFTAGSPIESSIIIEDKGRHQYADDYKNLTRDFYLHF